MKPYFTNDLIIKYDKAASKVLDKPYWRCIKGLKFYLGNKQNEYVEVLEGDLLDGATQLEHIPDIIPVWGDYGRSTAVHDKLCEDLIVYSDKGFRRITRLEADNIFDLAMKTDHVCDSLRESISTAVAIYRIATGVNSPRPHPLKKRLEVEWRRSQTQSSTLKYIGNVAIANIKSILTSKKDK